MAARRRRAQGRPQGGSEEIVRGILEATLVALEVDGFVGLRVEDVARAAGVNKTSVYRRWPSKSELVLAALGTTRDEEPKLAETGDVREDLVALLTAKAAQISTPRGRKILRALMAFDDDVAPVASALREHRYVGPRDLLARAIERGDLPRGSDAGFLTELLFAAILHRVLILNESVDADFVRRLVDHVLAGIARSDSAPTQGRRVRSKQH